MHKEIKLISKRNKVYRVDEGEGTYILKTFKLKEDFLREKELLSLLKSAGVNVPSIIKWEKNSLYLEDLGKETFLHWYEGAEKQDTLDLSVIYELSAWLKGFYKAAGEFYNEGITLHDVNFRNFIIVDNKIYGIDFEETKKGKVWEDAGKLLAYGLTYDPPMTEWKVNFRNKFIDILSKVLNIEKDKIREEEKKELKAIEKRRKDRRKG